MGASIHSTPGPAGPDPGGRGRLRAVLAGPYRLGTVRRATSVALFFLWFIVVTGATVRLTGSGLGCPEWPVCTSTSPVPAIERHALIEFINRMVATPTLLASLVATWTAWRVRGGPRRDLRLWMSLSVAGVLAQAGIGAFTVLLELPPWIVSIHFLASIAILFGATAAWVAAGRREPLRIASRAGGLAAVAGAVMLASLLAVIVAGVLVTASGPHSGSSGAGFEVDRLGVLGTAITYHARGAWVFLVLVVALTWARRRSRAGARDLSLLLGLVALQVALGEVQYRTGLPWGVVLAHVANAALVWIVACRVAIEAAAPAPDGDGPGDVDDEPASGDTWTMRAPAKATTGAAR